MNFSELNNNAEWEFDKFKDYSDTYQFWMPFFKYGFCYMYETMLTEGRLVYEYNPFYNFRVSLTLNLNLQSTSYNPQMYVLYLKEF